MKARRRYAPQVALAAVAVLVALMLAELALRTFGSEPEDEPEESATIESSDRLSERRIRTTVHPYLGWSWRPGVVSPRLKRPGPFFSDSGPSEWTRSHSQTNQLGLFSAIDDYRTVTEDDFVIGVFGGSVAADLVILAGDRLAARVGERMPSAGRIVVLNFAVGGYKQPQQLIALGQAIVLGIPLDVVVSLDGFNEIVFGRLNAAAGYHPIFPSRGHYNAMVGLQTNLLSEERLIAAADSVRERRTAERVLLRLERTPLLRDSRLAGALAGALARRHRRRAVELEAELQKVSRDSVPSSLAELDAPCIQEGRTCARLIGDLWGRSSELMHALTMRVDARYLHVLQPNQYIPGSKVLTEREVENAYDLKSHYARHTANGYPALQRRGEELRARGVDFHDLTAIFEDVRESLYVDRCCHFNHAGQALLAQAIGDLIVAARVRDSDS